MMSKDYSYLKKYRALKRVKISSSSSSETSSGSRSRWPTRLSEGYEEKIDEFDLNDVGNSSEKEYDCKLTQKECANHQNLNQNHTVFTQIINEKINVLNSSVTSFSSNIDSSSSSSSSSTHMSTNSSAYSSNMEMSVLSNNSKQLPSSTEKPLSFKEKLQDWCINNIMTLRNKTTTELLGILHEEGHTNLPKTAETLLKTKEFSIPTKIIPTAKENNGLYTYFGLEQVLKLMLNSSNYCEDKIEILVNIDGLPIYKNSDKQFWPILIKIYHKDYVSKPAAVALYCGDSKPKFVKDLLSDFTDEANKLIRYGVVIENKSYMFRIKGFCCDCPARAAIKCCKGHGGFYACERCETKGLTVNRKRVYPELNCKLRTKESFIKKTQIEHHKKNETSPLVEIDNFDPTKQVFLEAMHLFALGIEKGIFEQFIDTSSSNKLSTKQKSDLNKLLQGLSSGIPMEFQRKCFDLRNFCHWKATQHQLILLYALPLLIKRFVSARKYKHLLLLFVGARIIFSVDLAVSHSQYARELLVKFFKLLPGIFGKDMQVINFHNIIHVVDDVEYMEAPLSDFSAFPFENFLGQLKKLVRSPKNPLVQVARRLHEMQTRTSTFIRKKNVFTDYLTKGPSCAHVTAENNDDCDLLEIKFKETTLRPAAPDNIVRLINKSIFRINKIFIEGGKLKMEGYKVNYDNAFKYPCESDLVGIVQVVGASKKLKLIQPDQLLCKCLQLKIGVHSYIMQLLHH